MGWRDRAIPVNRQTDDGRPTLESVLDHYAIKHTYRLKQMVNCPLQDDRHPSCSVNLDKQLWKCHSCGAGGDVWELIMAMEEVDFSGARAFATRVGLADEGAGGSSNSLHRGATSGRGSSRLSRRSGYRNGASSYTPSWRRK